MVTILGRMDATLTPTNNVFVSLPPLWFYVHTNIYTYIYIHDALPGGQARKS